MFFHVMTMSMTMSMTMRPCWALNPVEGVGGEKGVEEAGKDGVQCPELGSLWDALSLGDLYRPHYTYGGAGCT